jgi:predicted outer membrane repeat protein
MKAKSMLTKSLGCLLLLMTSASFTPTARAIDSDANSADPNDAVTVTASLLRDSYALGQAVPLEILVTNHGEEPVYTYVDESGYLNLSVLLEDINGNRIPTGPVPEPPPPPRHWWITVDGKQIFTVPVVEIASGQTIKLTIQDALGLYHDRLQPGIYYLIPSDLTVIHEVGSIITRQDQEHKLWIEPSAVISKARYEINNVEITLHKEKIIYVDDDAVGNNDGTSWDNAYTSIQDALTDADAADKPIEVHVAKGVYKPYQGAESSSIAFRLINGVTLSGGYAGLKEQDPNIRDVEKYRTILSGDLNGDDIDVNNPSDLPSELTRSENFAGIVIGSGTDRTAVLDGFIIAGGYGGAPLIETLSGGAGMMNESGSPTINNCTFAVNSAAIGGGMMNRNDSNPILTNCKFIKNNARIGGAVYNLNSNPTFINCIFTNNYADDGAGMSISCSETTHALSFELIDCTFENNNTKNTGGGLIIYSCDLVLTNCFFIGNSASQGGGIYSGSGNPQLTNCQFISNSASEGGGMYNDSGIPNLINCQFIKNNALVTGGGLDSNDEANTLLIHCTFIDNSSNKSGGGIAGSNSIYNCIMSGNTAVNDGGAIYGWGEVGKCTVLGNKASGNGGGICTQGIITLNNSIFNNNYALHGDEIYIGLRYKHITGVPPTTIIVNSVATMRYNNIQGGEENISIENNCTLAWESGNTDEDPLFVNPGYWADADDPNVFVEPNDPNAVWIDGDYHLKSQAGRWDPASESWTVDDVTSPCIDAGDPNSPIGYEPFPNGGIINMGAYGGTPQASKSINDESL